MIQSLSISSSTPGIMLLNCRSENISRRLKLGNALASILLMNALPKDTFGRIRVCVCLCECVCMRHQI